MARAILKVDGMSCDHCVRSVTTALESVSGVRDVRVDLERGSADIEYDEELTGTDALEAAVAEEGYDARVAP